MEISSMGRVVAEQVIDSARSFGAGLDQSIANQGRGHWGPGPLWDPAILDMRGQAGDLAANLDLLKAHGDGVLEQLPAELRLQLDEQLQGAKYVLDEIHTDKGGAFVDRLTSFRSFGNDVAAKLQELLDKADEAKAAAAGDSVRGADVLSWDLDDTSKQAVKVTEQAAQAVQARAAGGR